MSVQFGRWNFDGAPADQTEIRKVAELLSPHAADGLTVETAGPVTQVFGAFHTTTESRRECQPYISPNGDRTMWDGRLDNRADCVGRLYTRATQPTDLEIVAAAYDRWNSESFGRLIGDWALSIWSPSRQRLVLARDFLGARHLYYSLEDHRVTWSTILEPLVLLRNGPIKVCEEYVAGWLSVFPDASLTPYEGIYAVPPASYLVIRQGEAAIHKHWRFNPEKRTRHQTDQQYEDHFRAEFRESIRRHIRSDRPVLAELSGGMDSSSIVCAADHLMSHASLGSPRLDTVSYYDDSEPNWDERPYFMQVEERRGKAGHHIDASRLDPLNFSSDNKTFLASPASRINESGFVKEFSEYVASGPYRVLLSGVGGDEVTGGIPTPLPELADLFADFEFAQFGRQLLAWSFGKKKPAYVLLFHAVAAFLPPRACAVKHPSWLHPQFIRRNQAALCGYPQRLKFFGGLPSFQANMLALEALRRQLGCTPLPSLPPYEKRYPFLDRDFLAFCYSLPREQLVRPHQRRSLLRRAMTGIVPDEILNRKRKAFVRRRLTRIVLDTSRELARGNNELVSVSMGIIEEASFLRALHEAAHGNDVALVPIVRAMALEQWLRSLTYPLPPGLGDRLPLGGRPFLGREQSTRKGGD